MYGDGSCRKVSKKPTERHFQNNKHIPAQHLTRCRLVSPLHTCQAIAISPRQNNRRGSPHDGSGNEEHRVAWAALFLREYRLAEYVAVNYFAFPSIFFIMEGSVLVEGDLSGRPTD